MRHARNSRIAGNMRYPTFVYLNIAQKDILRTISRKIVTCLHFFFEFVFIFWDSVKTIWKMWDRENYCWGKIDSGGANLSAPPAREGLPFWTFPIWYDSYYKTLEFFFWWNGYLLLNLWLSFFVYKLMLINAPRP